MLIICILLLSAHHTIFCFPKAESFRSLPLCLSVYIEITFGRTQDPVLRAHVSTQTCCLFARRSVNVCFRRKSRCYCGSMIVFLILATKRSNFLVSRCFISQNKTTRGIRGQRVMAGLCKCWLQNFGPARCCWCISTVKLAFFQCLHRNKWFTVSCTLIWSQNN